MVPGKIVLVLDTTFFGKRGKDQFGVSVFRSYHHKKNLLWKEVGNERMEIYKEGVRELQEKGWIIEAIVCDGKKGFFSLFPGIPTQMCQFHQLQAITRYLTKRPKTPAGKELRAIALTLTKTDKESFTFWLSQWYGKHERFFKEHTLNPLTGRKVFTHRRLRSAYRSLTRNLPYLWTWYDHAKTMDIPNTTNCLDGTFSHLKNKANIHRGTTKERKLKLFFSLLSDPDAESP